MHNTIIIDKALRTIMKRHMSQKLYNNIKYTKSSGLFGVHLELY